MRLRNIRGAREAMAESPYVIDDPVKWKGRWKELFGNNRPIRIEVGMGKGRFLTALAKANPDVNYIGIEKYSSVLLRALQLREQEELDNLYYLRMEAELLPEIFDEGEVDHIYLNFSDPWPKDRHAKRRLTSAQFLERYDRVLKPEGLVEFKTDNQELFDFSLESVREAGWELLASTRDLHHDEALCAGNVMTEYEERYSAEGKPICKLTAFRKR